MKGARSKAWKMPLLAVRNDAWRGNPVIVDAKTGGFVAEITLPIDDRAERTRRANYMAGACNEAHSKAKEPSHV